MLSANPRLRRSARQRRHRDQAVGCRPMGDDYKYDVAISFLSRDESLAREIAEQLAPLRVFVYSKAQGEVAGREGIATFRTVFRELARVALVLFRTGWGLTDW